MTYPWMLDHLYAHQIVDQPTGHHTLIRLSLKLLTSCTAAIRCLEATSILYLVFGLLHWHLIVILHLLPITLTCMMPLIQRLSVMFPGRVLVHGTMAFCMQMISRTSG